MKNTRRNVSLVFTSFALFLFGSQFGAMTPSLCAEDSIAERWLPESNEFWLPNLADDHKELELKSLTIETSILDDKGKRITVGGSSRRIASWRDDGNPWQGRFALNNRISWPMLREATIHSDEQLSKFNYLVGVSLSTRHDRRAMHFRYQVPLKHGGSSLASPFSRLKTVTIDAEQMRLTDDDDFEVTIRCTTKELVLQSGLEEKEVRRKIRVTFPDWDEEDREVLSKTVLLPPSCKEYSFDAVYYRGADDDLFEIERFPWDKDLIRLTPAFRGWEEDGDF